MRRYVVMVVPVLLVTATVLFAVLRPHSAAARRGHTARTPTAAQVARLDPTHFSALRTASTLVAGVPAAAQHVGVEYRPAAGQAHRLGPSGIVVAWVHGGEVCEAESSSWGCVPPQPGPVELTAEDPDVVGAGEPPRALGLAVDGVVDVRVTLDDGRTMHAAPVANFYSIDLPADALPPYSMTVEATMSDGSVFRTHVPR